MKKYLPLVITLAVLLTTKVFPQHSGPFSQFACIGDTAVFTVEHSFDYETFEWQVSEGPAPSNFSPIAASGGYDGVNTNVLQAYTTVLNPASGGIYKYYRCKMTSSIYGDQFSDTAFLEINIPPTVEFNWENPCENQTVNFESIVGTEAGPYKYYWTFGDANTSVSVYPDPSHIYIEQGLYDVSLTVTDVNGCERTMIKQVKIYGIPDFYISGKEVVCSNELGVKYTVDYSGELDGDTVLYNWDISGFGTIEDNTLQDVHINWNAVTEPTQTKILITATIEPSGCITQFSADVLITSYVAPPPAEVVFRKPNESSLLIYKGPEVNSYQWGFTDDKGIEYEIAVTEGGTRFYCDFDEIRSDYEYWIETSYDSRINCVTRSYLLPPYKIISGQASDEPLFTVYPVPASNQLTIRFDNIENPSSFTIYNLMMQKVYSNTNLGDSRVAFTLGLEQFLSGIYIIRVTDEYGLSNFQVFTIEK